MKEHCDRCECLLVEAYPSWTEIGSKIFHIYINVNTDGHEESFCFNCKLQIIEKYLEDLKIYDKPE